MNNNELKIGNKTVVFDYKVKEIVNSENLIIILLEIPFTDSEANNVFAYNQEGHKLWRVNTKFDEHDVKNKLPFEMIRIIDGKLYASDFYGRRFHIDLKTGDSKLHDVVR